LYGRKVAQIVQKYITKNKMTLEEYLEKIDKEEAYKLPEDILKDEGARNLSSTDLRLYNFSC
jgi:hypothetical protein